MSIGKEDNKVKEENSDNGFFSTLKEKLDEVNEKQIKSANTAESFIKGDDVDIHKVMLDSEEAKMSLELAVQVRNKIVEAYQELNRMQL
nr:flagellar hook-basal body complex protein FliE [Clostridium liquoris]